MTSTRTYECVNCGVEFLRYASLVKTKLVYCSRDCQGAYRSKLALVPNSQCTTCGTPIHVRPGRLAANNYCANEACKPLKITVVKCCVSCGTEIVRSVQHASRENATCSPSCQMRHLRKRQALAKGIVVKPAKPPKPKQVKPPQEKLVLYPMLSSPIDALLTRTWTHEQYPVCAADGLDEHADQRSGEH